MPRLCVRRGRTQGLVQASRICIAVFQAAPFQLPEIEFNSSFTSGILSLSFSALQSHLEGTVSLYLLVRQLPQMQANFSSIVYFFVFSEPIPSKGLERDGSQEALRLPDNRAVKSVG
jgi:hypothetical protein